MTTLITVCIDSLLVWISTYLIGKVIFEKHLSDYRIMDFIVIIVFSLILGYLNYINSEILRGVLKILMIYCLYCIFYKINFKMSYSKCGIAALIVYLAFVIAEVIIAIPLSVVSYLLNFDIACLKNTIIINVAISFGAFILVFLTRNKMIKLVNNANLNKKSKVLMIIIILITMSLLGFKLPVNEWSFNVEFIITMLILLLICIVGIFMLKQNSDIEKTSSMYQQVVKYSNTTNKLLEDYRMVSHEHKNQLSIIRQMVNKNNKELIEYIDNLIDKRNYIKYKWVADLNNIPDEGLKGLINYKLLEAEENEIKLTVIISKEISKVKLNNLNTKEKDELYSIVGVYLDNAIQAANESKSKEINLEIYKDQKEVIFVLGNTYNGKIDINKVDNYGYSTKGKNHGIGLHIVKNILEGNSLYTQRRELLDEYYIQYLTIHTNCIKK